MHQATLRTWCFLRQSEIHTPIGAEGSEGSENSLRVAPKMSVQRSKRGAERSERSKYWSGRSRRRRKAREQQAHWHIVRVAEGKEERAAEQAREAAISCGEPDVDAVVSPQLPDGYIALKVSAKPSVVEAITQAQHVFTFVQGLSTGWSDIAVLKAPGSEPIIAGDGSANRVVHKRARLIVDEARDNGEDIAYSDALDAAARELELEAVSEQSATGQGYTSLEEVFSAAAQENIAGSPQSSSSSLSSSSRTSGRKSKDKDLYAPYSDNAEDDEVRNVFEQQLREYEKQREEELLRKEGKVLGSRRSGPSNLTRQPDSDIERKEPAKPPQQRRQNAQKNGSAASTSQSASPMRIHKGDAVRIVSGRNKGLEGRVLQDLYSATASSTDPNVTLLTTEPNFGAEIELTVPVSCVEVTKRNSNRGAQAKQWRASSRGKRRKRLQQRAEDEEEIVRKDRREPQDAEREQVQQKQQQQRGRRSVRTWSGSSS